MILETQSPRVKMEPRLVDQRGGINHSFYLHFPPVNRLSRYFPTVITETLVNRLQFNTIKCLGEDRLLLLETHPTIHGRNLCSMYRSVGQVNAFTRLRGLRLKTCRLVMIKIYSALCTVTR